ncbi:hypothetical protein A2215_02440 [Candidatus Berkelbacteria bacterium RIFOXYA2_FULL_43_10]|uniref:Uncharacterized protein n=1 Tax=Candidatus Berkelbacteria bacterium RIFOXYA2_FULL_43_10 TaxID=1797472 RepID=A0A1F5ED78_9BACT|nr:MAG: hypothetical protein A2215_02440 [Candidatus Berkelbacteria bacterium RIFOXYA2_FULL_43_10]
MINSNETPIFYEPENIRNETRELRGKFDCLLEQAVSECAELQRLIARSQDSSAEDATKLASVQEIIEQQLDQARKLNTKDEFENAIRNLEVALDYIKRISGSYEN